jgi:hypothetical protein
MGTRSMLALVVVALLSFTPMVWSQAANERSAVYDLAAGSQIRMDLEAGEYVIKGSPDEKVRIVWSADRVRDAENVKVRFNVNQDGGTLHMKDTKKAHITIHVPSRSDVRINLSAGELSLFGIEGNKDIELTAGELRVNVGDPAAYRDVSSSVSIGEINARPFQVNKDGFFRSFQHVGQGKYSLRAAVGVGEVHLSR